MLWILFGTLGRCRDGLLLVLTPLALSPLLIWHGEHAQARCAFVALLMVVYWIFQPIPLAVTALLPIVLFPLLDLASTEKACEPYLQATNMLFLASLIIAVAMESSAFHKRIALRTLLSMGSNLRILFAGFMFTTMFLGVWIINTAATAMILPIADVVVEYLFQDSGTNQEIELPLVERVKHEDDDDDVVVVVVPVPVPGKVDPKPQPKKMAFVKRLLYICVAYSATIGGTTTLTSNGPNLVLRFVLDDMYHGLPPVDYANWLLFCLPATLVSISICWLLICYFFLTKDVLACINKSPKIILEKKYRELGPMTFHELMVCILFVLLIILWMLRDPQFMSGWVSWLDLKIKPKDTTPAMLIVFLMFCIPSQPLGPYPSESLLSWESAQRKVAWGVILFRGGGFSLANQISSTGLTKLIGARLTPLNTLPTSLVVACMSLLASFTTEVSSNSTIATIFLPISAQMATELNVNPLLFLVPVTLSCSFAFILPVGTPANALVASHAHLKSTDMIVPGVMVKLSCILVMLLNLNVSGDFWFGLNALPGWAELGAGNHTRL